MNLSCSLFRPSEESDHPAVPAAQYDTLMIEGSRRTLQFVPFLDELVPGRIVPFLADFPFLQKSIQDPPVTFLRHLYQPRP